MKFCRWKMALILVFVCLTLSACCLLFPSKQATIVAELGLWKMRDKVTVQEEYNSYCGCPYERIALYTINLPDEAMEKFEQWEKLPYDEQVYALLEKISSKIEMPQVSIGKYKFADRNPDSPLILNATLIVIDTDHHVGYYLKFDS